MPPPDRVPDEALSTLIDPDIREEIGDPIPVAFAATVVYVPLLIFGAVTTYFVNRRLPQVPFDAVRLLSDVAVGLAIALALVGITFVASRRMPALQALDREFRRVVGKLSRWQAVRLATLSGVAEELLFRGTLLPLVSEDAWLGWGATHAIIWTSVLFGLLHFLPHKIFLPWTFFATAVGFIAGGAYVWRGSLVAPLVAHVALNAINLRLIASGRRQPLAK